MNHNILNKVIPLALLLSGGILLVWLWTPITTLFSDLEALQSQIAILGIWGPLALIILSVLQVLIAPLPGYPIVFVSGLLYGTWWGAIYANLGLLLAGMVAMWLSRKYGRPLAERFVQPERLKKLEKLLSSNSTWMWFLILFIAPGDYPYFVAGLSQVSFRTFFIALCLARLPFTFVLTYAAENSFTLSSEITLGLALLFITVLGIAYWQQERITRGAEKLLERLVPRQVEQE